MSFASSHTESVPTQPQDDVDRALAKFLQQLQSLSSLMLQFESQRRLLGSRRDTTQFRLNTEKLRHEILQLDGALSKVIAQMSRLQGSSGQIMRRDRLVSEYHSLSEGFQLASKTFVETKEQVAVSETTPLKQTQLQLLEEEVSNTDVQYHIQITQERNREIGRVADGIREVNAMFKDLGALVEYQGEQLDTIEDNILQVHGDTQQASRELNKAHEYQKKKSKWSCIILVALCVFVLVIVLAVLS